MIMDIESIGVRVTAYSIKTKILQDVKSVGKMVLCRKFAHDYGNQESVMLLSL